MKTRILSGLIMAPLLVVLFLGGYVLLAACFVIGVMAAKEFYDGFGNMGIRPSYVTAYAAILGLYAINMFTSDYHWYMVWFFGCVVASLLYLFRIEERRLEDAMATITGIFYVIFFSYHVLLVEQTGEYSLMLWLIVLTAFGTDIMAYFAGVFFGKHKLCPQCDSLRRIRVDFHSEAVYSLPDYRSPGRRDFSVRGFDRFHFQEKNGNQGLWKSDPGTWRNFRSV